jgi:hypothetical protein
VFRVPPQKEEGGGLRNPVSGRPQKRKSLLAKLRLHPRRTMDHSYSAQLEQKVQYQAAVGLNKSHPADPQLESRLVSTLEPKQVTTRFPSLCLQVPTCTATLRSCTRRLTRLNGAPTTELCWSPSLTRLGYPLRNFLSGSGKLEG